MGRVACKKEREGGWNDLLAGGMSGYYLFRENFYEDNGVIPFLLVIDHLSKIGKPLSALMRPYTEGHYMSGELNYRVEDIKRVISEVRARFSSRGKENFTDG